MDIYSRDILFGIFAGGLICRVICRLQPKLYKLHIFIILSCGLNLWIIGYSSVIFGLLSLHKGLLLLSELFSGTSIMGLLSYSFREFQYYINHIIWIFSIVAEFLLFSGSSSLFLSKFQLLCGLDYMDSFCFLLPWISHFFHYSNGLSIYLPTRMVILDYLLAYEDSGYASYIIIMESLLCYYFLWPTNRFIILVRHMYICSRLFFCRLGISCIMTYLSF